MLWEQYIHNRFSHDKNEKLKKIALNVPALKKWSMKVSLINELMKGNLIEEENLFTALGENSKECEDFKKNPLLSKLVNQEKYFFEHRNIQEYFAATALSKLSSEKMKGFLLIKNAINKTHPSLFNTITFLLNILEDDKYSELVGWLIENEPELLFKADSNRTDRYKVKVFQHYFQSECVEKTFWINSSKTFSTKEIAEFGNCDINFEYLLGYIKNADTHFRVKISALELLGHFNVAPQKIEDLKKTLYSLLLGPENSEMIKSHLLDCIHNLRLCENDEGLLDSIFELFKDETSKQINRALLSLIEEYKNIDRFFWYIKSEYLRDRGFMERKVADDVIRGTSWVLDRLILRFNLSSNFIDLARHSFDEAADSYIDSKYIEEIIDRCCYFENLDSTFLVNLFASFREIKDYHFRETAVKDLIFKSNRISRQNLFEYLTENEDFQTYGYFLAYVTDELTIEIIIDKFFNGTIESANLDFYRNVLGNTNNRKLAEYFNDKMIDKGFDFKEQYLNQNEFEKLVAKSRKRPQENFDILFDKESLLCKIEAIFNRYGGSINPTMIRQITTDWYKENGNAGRIELSYSLLGRIVHNYKLDLNFSDIKHILEKEDILIIKEIKAQIQQLNNSNIFFEINSAHIEFLHQWCMKAKEEIDFTNIIRVVNLNSCNLLGDYYKFKAVLYFVIRFSIEVPQEFLLNSIEFIDINKTVAQDGILSQLLPKIKSQEDINKTIIRNLLNGNIYSLSLNSHIQYALDHKLHESFKKIGEYLMDKNYSFNIERVLKQYIELTNNFELLINLCDDIRSHKCWTSLKLMMELKIQSDFCLQKALLYLDDSSDDENYYFSSALAVLFELNSLHALHYLISFINSGKLPNLQRTSYTSFNIIDNYKTLDKLYDSIYNKNEDKFELSGIKNFMAVYVSNLSEDTAKYLLVQEELASIKSNLEKSSNKELYYINQLIDDSKKGYLISQSKTFSFNEALSKVEQIIN